ncbi:GNAT family N-acetyltransferase [Sinomonas sp. JGH33]|uniref:GNAT family N-acetyltransferase n=1 Tax=Sinomonas terricola TaxID=3110330 RepID=A0ABU5T7B8_9MICC|nr:GNAT family N-acetyltransferase [Sinomonas sp. JGH33]MEA5455583.1 GNAT family N-acetyltransferase [Sinomonas sp. JGH33]
MSIVWKPIEPSDTPSWAELSNLLATADGSDEHYAPEDLAEELEEPGVDPILDTLGGWEGRDMVAYGQLRVGAGLRDGIAKAFLGGGVHPGWRGRGLGRAVMDWIEPRAAQLAGTRHPGAPGLLSVWAGTPGSASSRLAAARGYRPARYLQDLQLDLADWSPQLTDLGHSGGLRRHATGPGVPFDVADGDLAEGTRRAHNEAFAQHRGTTERDQGLWAAQLSGSTFRPELSRVALSTDGALAPRDAVDGYVLCGEYVPGELYVCFVGTRRRARGRGVATGLLVDVLTAAKEEGFRVAALGVDAESPLGGVGLYERIGFRRVRTDVVYEKPLAAHAEIA